MKWNKAWPPPLVEAVRRWGEPVGVEDARHRWSDLVKLAESGTATLITNETPAWTWAVLVPLAELYEAQWNLPAHAVSKARPKLGELVREAQTARPQLLYRHYTAAAALMSADRMISVAAGERVDVDELLHQGATITLTYDPGVPGRCGFDGNVEQDPEPSYTLATALDPCGGEIGTGTGATAAEALAALHRRPAEPPITYTPPSADFPF